MFETKDYEIVIQYLKNIVGDGCEVLEDGTLEHWTPYPHGSGTTTDKGPATTLQKLAWELQKQLKYEKKKFDDKKRIEEVLRYARSISKEERAIVLKSWGVIE